MKKTKKIKKATIKPTTPEKILKAHGVSKKKEALILERYRKALKKPKAKCWYCDGTGYLPGLKSSGTESVKCRECKITKINKK